MKKIFVMLLFASVFLLLNSSVSGQEQKVKSDAKKTSESQSTAVKPGKIFNKVCPVMGDELDKDAIPFVYKGKTYGLCCKRCVKKMEKDPEKYIRNLSEDGTKFLKK